MRQFEVQVNGSGRVMFQISYEYYIDTTIHEKRFKIYTTKLINNEGDFSMMTCTR